MTRQSVLDCFTPPEGFDGDFGWVCGFTAHPDVLGEVTDRFTQGARRRRLSLAVLLHPQERHLPLRPGVAVLFPRPGKKPWANLLHAKVALLHFRNEGDSILRLVVSTGNWTFDPVQSSLDMFWIVEWREGSPDIQVAADVRAAAEMFEWLRPHFDSSVLEVNGDTSAAEAALRSAISSLPSRRLPPPRFIDTRKYALQPQILSFLARHPGRRNRLVMGSGYFEDGEEAEAGVLKDFVRELEERQLATMTRRIDLVINPYACQGLAGQAEELTDEGWNLHPPYSAGMPGAKLHAKFIFGAGGSRNCTSPWCYIGSGNLSRIGFTLASRSGNLEAGVVFVPDEALTWDGDDGRAVATRLPVDFEQSVGPSELLDGEAYEAPGGSADVPPVSFLCWGDGWLTLPEGVDEAPGLTVRLPNGHWQELPVAMVDAPAVAVLGPMMAEVPVLAGSGFVLPPLRPRRVEDVLRDLASFPRTARDDRDEDVADDIVGSEDSPVTRFASKDYPLRRMMRLISRLTEHQARLSPVQWERWLNRVRDALTAISEPEQEMIETTRKFGVDPLEALLHPAFLPPSLQAHERDALAVVVRDIRKHWKFEGLDPLVPQETSP